MSLFPHNLKVGLALGSGGARGWAHIGALNCLVRHEVPLHCVSGTSAGAIFGSAFAAGRLDLANELAEPPDWHRLFELFVEVGLPRSGLLTGRRIQTLLNELVGNNTFATLTLPFAAVATDLASEQEVVLDSGSVGDAVRASIAIPGILTPVSRKGRLLVDGGLVNPLPINVARALGADYVIAVDVNLNIGAPPPPPKSPDKAAAPPPAKQETSGDDHLATLRHKIDEWAAKLPPLRHASRAALARWTQHDTKTASIFDVLAQAGRIVENQITRSRLALEPPDLLVQPAVGYIQTLEFNRAHEAVAAGDAAMEEALRRIKAQATQIPG